MRICLYTPTFFPVMGGAELFCDIFARGMIARGHEVVVIAQKMKSPRELQLLPYPVVLYRRPPLQHLCTELLARPFLRQWRKHHFDVCVTVYGYPLAYAVSRVKKKLKVGLISVAQGADLYPNFNPKNKPRVNRLIKLGYQQSDHIVGVSSTMAERARAMIGDAPTPISIIHNAVDLKAWNDAQTAACAAALDSVAVAHEFGLKPGAFTLQVAGLRHVKRPDLAIGAVAKCRDVYDSLNWKHVMVGEGKTGSKYHDLARELGIADRIVFTGLRTGQDKHWLFANARFLMHTSDEEGLPFVLSEAAASGLPLLVSDIQPHTEFLGNSACGQTFRHGQLDDLAAALGDMLRADLTVMREKSLARAQDFSSDKMLDAYERLCRDVIALAQSAS